ncbi:hypothetical protein FBR02_05120 [Anaerolineae bacterium CFX9]|nr:hypothetical protein [Anaerolineae bacterium CFX9]
MPDVRIVLSALWVATMLVYLLGDVLRIFSGDFPERMDTKHFSQRMWLGIAVLMLIPILMLLVSVMVDQPVSRWANIIAAGFFFIFNLIGLPTYPSAYDKFLLAVSMIFNVLVIWYAWNWQAAESVVSALSRS